MPQRKILKGKVNAKIKSCLLLSWTFSFMLCMFAPLELFCVNQEEFWFNLFQIVPIFAVIFLIMGLLLSSFFGLVYNKKIGIYVYSFLLCALLYFYVQGNYVPREYGVLNGADIDWNSYGFYGVISIVLILVFLTAWVIICLKIKEKVYLVGRVICIVLGLTQLVTIGTLYIQNNVLVRKTSNDIVATEKDMFYLSRNNNILVFLLDAFDSSVMQDMLEREGSKEIFENFIYYPDTLGAYPTTKGALPQILTGEWYKNEQTYPDYINEAYHDNGLYKELEKNDYSIGIYTNSVFIGDEGIKFVNVEKGNYTINNYGLFAGKMYELVAFNYMPHQLKRFFWISTSEFDNMKKSTSEYGAYSGDVQNFYRLLKDGGITVTEDKNCFRFYHIEGVHMPYTFDKNLNSIEDRTYEVYDEAEGNFTLLKELFQLLREREMYDNTTIVIMADHGQMGYGQNPLFMIKNVGCSQKFTVSDKKITYDYLPDIFSSLVKGVAVDEKYMEDIGKNRESRSFMYYTWDDSWDKRYLPQMREYVLYGEAKDSSAMMLTGNVYMSEEDKSVCQYALGKKLFFMGKNTVATHLLYGFSDSEEEFMWTDGTKAGMFFDIEDEYLDLRLTMEYSTYMDSQHVIISVNGNKIDDYQARGDEEKSITIPGEYVEDGKLMLTFEFPEASSPSSQGLGADERILALAMKTLTISAAD